MNALVSIRANGLGQFSPTQEKKAQVAQQTTALARATLQGMAKSGDIQKSASTSDDPGTRSLQTKTLDKDMFLQLLVQQMQSQDPLEPMDNAQMLSQLAQFTSLEQMNNLNSSFETLSGNVDQLNFISASSMIGRQVTGVDTSGNQVSGVISSVAMKDSVVYLMVGDKVMSMAGVAHME